WLFAVVIWASTASTVAEGQEWSLLTGGTMGVKSGALHVQAGWASASPTLLYGGSPGADLGMVFTFNYAFEGDVTLDSLQRRPPLRAGGPRLSLRLRIQNCRTAAAIEGGSPSTPKQAPFSTASTAAASASGLRPRPASHSACSRMPLSPRSM